MWYWKSELFSHISEAQGNVNSFSASVQYKETLYYITKQKHTWNKVIYWSVDENVDKSLTLFPLGAVVQYSLIQDSNFRKYNYAE